MISIESALEIYLVERLKHDGVPTNEIFMALTELMRKHELYGVAEVE